MTTLSTQLAQLENAQIVRLLADPDLAYFFRHALTQETAYDSLLLKKRRTIHRYVAEAYEELYAEHLAAHAAEFAYHYSQAGDDAKTVEYSLQAADAAIRLYAYPEARGHILRVLDALKRLPDTPDLIRLRVDAIDTYVEVGWGAHDTQELFALVTEAEQLARILPNPDGTLGDRPRLARIHQRLTGAYFARGDYAQTVHYARLVLEELRVLDDTTLMGPPLCQLGLALVTQGRFTDAMPFLVQAITLLDASRDRWEWYTSVACLGLAQAMHGEIAAGMAEGERALAHVQATNNSFGITNCFTFLLSIYLETGDMPGLAAASAQAITAALKSDMPMNHSLGLGFQAMAASRMGESAPAQEMMAQARQAGARVGGQFMMSDWVDAANAEIAWNAGSIEQAIALAEQTIRTAQSVGGIFAGAWARRVLGQALAASMPPQWEQAETSFASAVELFQGGGAVLEAAHTHRVWGHALEAWGKPDAAREHFALSDS